MTKADAIHEICIISGRLLNQVDGESYKIGCRLSDIADALGSGNLDLLQARMKAAGTIARDIIPDEAFKVILDLGGCDLSPTKYR